MLADIWPAVGGVASLVAAGAALVTVWYARSTVGEARLGRQEAHAAHLEDVREARGVREAADVAHREQMAERERALARETGLQRVLQAERISEVLIDLVDVARHESTNPPPELSRPPVVLTRVPGILTRLRVALAAAERLGCPRFEAASQLAMQPYGRGWDPLGVVSGGIGALDEIGRLLDNAEEFHGVKDRMGSYAPAQSDGPTTEV